MISDRSAPGKRIGAPAVDRPPPLLRARRASRILASPAKRRPALRSSDVARFDRVHDPSPPAADSGPRSQLARLASVIAAPLLFFVTLPLVVYAFNVDSVDVPKAAILESGLVATALVAAGLWLLALLPRLGRAVTATCDIVAVALFALILVPNRTGEITGLADQLSGLGNRGPLLKLAALLALAALAHRFRPNSLRALAQTTVATAAVGSLAAALFVSSAADRSRRATEEESIRLFALGTESNVIVLVLDSFTGYRMVEIVAERPEIRAALAGFTLYPRAIAPAHNTPAGNSAILTGHLRHAIEIEGEVDRNTSSLADSFLAEADRIGVEAVYLSDLGVREATMHVIDEDSVLSLEKDSSAARDRRYVAFLALSSARVLPASAASALERWATSGAAPQADRVNDVREQLSRIVNPAQRIQLKSKLVLDRLLAALGPGESESKVLYVFSKMSHPPWSLTADGRFDPGAGPWEASLFAARQLVRLIEKLRELAALDDSLVVVASDHGTMPIADASMGGVFPAEHRLPRELNALVMVKPPRADHPLRVSKMSVWLGDIAATVRDALDLPQPTSSSSASRSLLLPDDPDRVLALPVFFRPDQVSYHAPLKQWTRVDVRGTFAEFGRAASLDPVVLLSRRGRIALHAGVDRYATSLAVQGLHDGEGILSSAWIEIDDRLIVKVVSAGAATLSDASGRFRVSSLEGAESGLAALSENRPHGSSFVAAVGIPRRLVSRYLDGATPVTEEDALVNCVFVASDRSRPRRYARCGPGDLELELEWQ